MNILFIFLIIIIIIIYMDNNYNQKELIQIYTVGILKDEINELRKLYLELREETNEIIKFMHIIDRKISGINLLINNDFEKKMNNLNLNF